VPDGPVADQKQPIIRFFVQAAGLGDFAASTKGMTVDIEIGRRDIQ
jgi:hypothetical protein